MQRFSDFSNEETQLEGDKYKIDDILNKEIIIINFRISKSKFNKNESGKYVTVQFKFEESDNLHIVFTGSDVLKKQLEKYGDNMPFIAIIKKINTYYTLS